MCIYYTCQDKVSMAFFSLRYDLSREDTSFLQDLVWTHYYGFLGWGSVEQQWSLVSEFEFEVYGPSWQWLTWDCGAEP